MLTRRNVPTHGVSMQSVDVFAALANPVRREILVQLQRGPRNVSDLAAQFTLGRPAVSEHLQVLRKAELVREEPRGRERFYHLDPRPLSDVESWLQSFERFWKGRLDDLERVLDEEDAVAAKARARPRRATPAVARRSPRK
jgi:DNA-binding transcriptional ArsR family regulator